ARQCASSYAPRSSGGRSQHEAQRSTPFEFVRSKQVPTTSHAHHDPGRRERGVTGRLEGGPTFPTESREHQDDKMFGESVRLQSHVNIRTRSLGKVYVYNLL